VRLGRRHFLHTALIAALTCAAYSGSFAGDFVSDDVRAVRDNLLIRGLDAAHVRRMFATFDDNNYMPIKVLSTAIDYRLWGLQPAGFHATNLLIHVAAASIIYAVLLRLYFSSTAALLTALLWAVHPLQVESVAWISERKNVLSGLFFCAAFLVYLRFSERPRATTYAAVLALFILAVLSKMNTMVLPAVCLAFEIAWRFRLRRRDLLATAPMFAIAAAVGWYNLSGNPIHAQEFHGGSALVTWLSSAVVVFRYLGNVVRPTQLCAVYDVPLRGSLLAPPVLAAVLGLVATAALTVRLVRTQRRAGFWVLWFGITLSPMLNLIPFRSLMNDRYMYLALLGPLALVVGPLSRTGRWQRLRTLAVAAAVVVCVGLTYRRVPAWASSFSLWTDGLQCTMYIPPDPVDIPSDFDAKVAFLRAAAARQPGSALLRNNLGALYYAAGQNDQAIVELAAAAQLDAGAAVIAMNLGEAYAAAYRFSDAKTRLVQAVALDPYSYLAHLGLLQVSLRLGDIDTARHALTTCSRIRPPHGGPDPLWAERAALEELSADLQEE